MSELPPTKDELKERCNSQSSIIAEQHGHIRKLENQLSEYRDLVLEALRTALQHSLSSEDQSKPSSQSPLPSD